MAINALDLFVPAAEEVFEYIYGKNTSTGMVSRMTRSFLTFVYALPLIHWVSGELFDLSRLDWTLNNQNGSIHIAASGPPSQAHIDLHNAGIITEPLLGINGITNISLSIQSIANYI